jgi:hypothetical protein
MARYINTFTGDEVIVYEPEYTDDSVTYTKMTPRIINGRAYSEFIKPRHVFDKIYKPTGRHAVQVHEDR